MKNELAISFKLEIDKSFGISAENSVILSFKCTKAFGVKLFLVRPHRLYALSKSRLKSKPLQIGQSLTK